MISAPRFTVADGVSFAGQGLHGGQPVRVTVHPGADGIAFRVGDQRVPATPNEVTDTRRCTQLGPVATIEHLMSAFAGLGITDAEIEVEGGEMPALDGSAKEFVAGLQSVGMAPCGKLHIEGLFKRVYFIEGDVKVAMAAGTGRVRYEYDNTPRWPGVQEVEFVLSPESYAAEIAPARTFAFREEVEPLRQMGLGLGLSEDSCVILEADGYAYPPRFPDEPARHKLLDLMGDLLLAVVPWSVMQVTAHRSGHRTNVAAAARLAECITITREN